MTFAQLKYLIALKECKTYSEAADSVHITFQALYKAIKTLEAELNLKLVESTARGTHLTANGIQIANVAEQFFSDIETIKKENFCTQKFEILIDVCKNYSFHQAIRTVLKKHPNVRFIEKSNAAIIEELENSRYKIAVINQMSINNEYSKTFSDNLEYVPIRKIKMDIYVAKNNKKIDKTKRTLEDYNGETFIVAQELTANALQRYVPNSTIIIETMPEIISNLLYEEGYFAISGISGSGIAHFSEDDRKNMRTVLVDNNIEYSEGFLTKKNSNFSESENEILNILYNWLKKY